MARKAIRSLVMCFGHPPKIQIQVVVVCSFDVYRGSQSGIIMQVKYAKASYVLRPLPVLRLLPRRFGPVRAFVRHLDVQLAIRGKGVSGLGIGKLC